MKIRTYGVIPAVWYWHSWDKWFRRGVYGTFAVYGGYIYWVWVSVPVPCFFKRRGLFSRVVLDLNQDQDQDEEDDRHGQGGRELNACECDAFRMFEVALS